MVMDDDTIMGMSYAAALAAACLTLVFDVPFPKSFLIAVVAWFVAGCVLSLIYKKRA